MNLLTIQSFLTICTVINGSLLVFWTLMLLLAPDLVFRTQKPFFPLSQEMFRVFMYGFLGAFKILFLVFNLVPLIAFLMVT